MITAGYSLSVTQLFFALSRGPTAKFTGPYVPFPPQAFVFFLSS